ncbi:IucA/IucC family protein [Anopheles sinensis]|uniref:IucA/IucC family protein n=1 Tax=Anopheles sinensis TaxID=74873 RepID=A0A084VVG5_ANOSI|nr:IucA/IucC family protein [Anopheles sinensis]
MLGVKNLSPNGPLIASRHREVRAVRKTPADYNWKPPRPGKASHRTHARGRPSPAREGDGFSEPNSNLQQPSPRQSDPPANHHRVAITRPVQMYAACRGPIRFR